MTKRASSFRFLLFGTIFCIVATVSGSQAQTISLDAMDQVKLLNVKAETVTFKGRKALRVLDAAAAGLGDEGPACDSAKD